MASAFAASSRALHCLPCMFQADDIQQLIKNETFLKLKIKIKLNSDSPNSETVVFLII